ncbi:hypothetical protein [Arthrobacter sp. RAF14]|uniref:hypothetical protein n=1 Tax=Arthrobacter sp. RAF14 TaxID=3233051 RepID=UPI003F912245
MGTWTGLPRESSNYRPGEPLRAWASGEPIAAIDAELALQAADAGWSVEKLLRGEELDDQDLIAFGRLNSYCVLQWYEPIVSLVRDPVIDPEVATFLTETIPHLHR